MIGATIYAFSALAYITNNEQFFPRLAHNFLGTDLAIISAKIGSRLDVVDSQGVHFRP